MKIPILLINSGIIMFFAAAPAYSQAVPTAGSVITIRNVNSGLCVDSGGYTTVTLLFQASCSGASSQNFTLQTAAATGYYRLANSASKLCWDAAGGSTSAARIQQYACVASWAEYYKLNQVSAGVYRILSGNMANGCIGVVGASTASGAAIEQNACNGSTNQTFQVALAGIPASTVAVSASPTSASVASAGTQQFTATVTGSTNTAVTWSATAGTISSSGLFIAPAVSTNTTVTVSATSQADTSKSASATVNVNAPVAVAVSTSPTSASVASAGTQQFTATVTGSTNTAVIWSATAGTISNSGLFTAPAVSANTTVTVTATSQADTSKWASAIVTVNAPVAVSVSISPVSASVVSAGTQQFTATVTGSTNTAVAWSATAGTISSSGLFTAPAVSTNTTVTVTATSAADATKSASASVAVSVSGALVNVTTFGATGNGTTNDTVAIDNAIAALTSGATLLFPCGTYLTTSQLTINRSNVTVDGSSCAIIRNTSSAAIMVIGGSGNGNPNYGPAVALSAAANELSTSFTTVSSLGVGAGDYVHLQQGGKDSSTGSGDTGCDPSGCRGEVLKVASVSGNTVTVTTALHDTYNPSVNAAIAKKILGPLTGITVKNISFDGSGSNVYGLAIAGIADSTISGVTARNVQGAALLNHAHFNVAWSNINVTGAGSAQCGDAVWIQNLGNLSVNGLSVSNENPGAPGTGCLYNGAFGFGMVASANGILTNVTVDAAGAYGRPFKTTSTRWTTFNSLTVKNGVQAYNGISVEYYSSHNTFNNCVVTNNGAGTGTGTGNAGINSFGNFNQYNTFNNCTVTGNGNIQFYVSSYDALRLGQDSGVTINGGTYTGTSSGGTTIEVEGSNVYIKGATISGPGSSGIGFSSYGTNGCINNNAFTGGTGLGVAINSSGSSNIGSGNILNGLSSNLTPGTCGPSGIAISISPTVATVASTGTQQFTASVTGSTNTAVTWSATAGSVSSSGLFTAPTVTSNTAVTVSAISQADTSQTASATVTVTPSAPPNTFGYAVQGTTVGTTMSNSVSATRYQMVARNATVTSLSVFVASPVSASPNNQFQVAIYADNNGAPGALIASSASQTIVPDAWNTVPISVPVTANAYYWLAYNTNGLAANTNNLRYDSGGATSTWITSEPFGTWPVTYVPIGGTSTYSTSMYSTFQ